MKNRFNLNEEEKNRIKGLHGINEQSADKSREDKLISDGYKKVNKINLPDGVYTLGGSGYVPQINYRNGESTGYVLVLNSGIRGFWSGSIKFVGGKFEGKHEKYINDYSGIFFNESTKGEEPKAGVITQGDKARLLYKAFELDNIREMSESDVDAIIQILKKYKGKLDLKSSKYGDVGEPFGL